MLNISSIQAISLDLDDTLWPVWPAIERAEATLLQWLLDHAPATAARYPTTLALRGVRGQLEAERPDLLHDLSAMRRESIRRALQHAGDDPALAEPAFEAFFAARQQVDFYADALPALARMAARYPMVALSNGNADVHRVGIGHLFHAAAASAQVAPHAVLHVGDDPLMDVVGAFQAGMQSVWVNRAGGVWSHGIQPQLQVAELAALCTVLGV